MTEILLGNIKGKDATITDVTASVDGTTGNPSVSVTMGGTASERSFHFAFSGLKGEKGNTVEQGVAAIDDEDIHINEEMPIYTEATELETLTSGEKISVAFGKIKKAISELISHIGDATKHITLEERNAWNNKSAEGHLHDDRYYTESEVDSKLTGKAPATHSHTKSEIIDFPTSLPASDVPDWAKQTSKPSYTADDVGAMSKTKHLVEQSVKEITEEGFYYIETAKDVPTSTKFGYVRVVVADANNRTISWHPRDAVAEYINTMSAGSWLGWCRISAAPM